MSAIVQALALYPVPKDYRSEHAVKALLGNCDRVVEMSISDANKRLMIQCDGLASVLTQCLLLDEGNTRRQQDGAEALQESAAAALLELSLFAPWAQALKADTGVMAALRELLDVGTKKSKEHAAAALFELDGELRASPTLDDGTGTGLGAASTPSTKPPPHVMASYNWDHQDVIMRVVGSLQSREYLVWVDLEQMKGSTVDTMALAVEGSEVVLVGVSRAYKEYSNCRMEALRPSMHCRRRSRWYR